MSAARTPMRIPTTFAFLVAALTTFELPAQGRGRRGQRPDQPAQPAAAPEAKPAEADKKPKKYTAVVGGDDEAIDQYIDEWTANWERHVNMDY